MAKGYMPLFFDTFEETDNLTDEEFGRLIRAAGYYATGKDGWESMITGNERYAFPFLKGQIDRNNKISKARAKAGAIHAAHEPARRSRMNSCKHVSKGSGRRIPGT